jgi:hypothetical protein
MNPTSCGLFRVALIISIAMIPVCLAQDATAPSSPLVVPEKVMAARLSNFVVPVVSKPPLTNRCSNALAMLTVDVDQGGRVSNVTFLSGFEELRDSAMTAVKQWVYRPYKQHGHAIAVETRVSIFYLGDGESFPMYSPDGRGGVKGGNALPLPPGCGAGPQIKRVP